MGSPAGLKDDPLRTSVRGRWCLSGLVLGYLSFVVLAGASNSPLTTPLPPGSGPPSWATGLAVMLGLGHLGRSGIVVAALILMAALLVAFVTLLVEAWAGRVRLSSVLLAAGLSLFVSTAGPLLLSRDVFSYAAYGRIAAVGHVNPYVSVPAALPNDPFVIVLSRQWLHARSPYGPAFTAASVGIVRTWSGSPSATILAFKVLAGGGVAVATVFVSIAARTFRPRRAALAAAIVGLSPVMVIHTVGGGHVDAVIAGILAAALALAVRPRGSSTSPRSLGVTLLLTLATLIKLVIAPALVLWVWWTLRATPPARRARTAATHLGLSLFVTAAMWAPFLSGTRAIGSLRTQAGREIWASASSLVGRLANALVGSVAGEATGTAAGRLVVAAFLLAYVVLFWRLGSARTALGARAPASVFATPADGWGTALLLYVLVAPFLLPWYAAWFAPFLGLMDDERMMRIGVALSAVLALTLIPADPPHGITSWGVMLGVHYVAASAVLVLFVAAANRVWTRGKTHPA